jgi:hypothetical protein
MKKILQLCFALLLVSVLNAQAPGKFNYQAVVRNAANQLVTGSPVGVRVAILKGSTTGSAVYLETHIPISNANGLVSMEVGSGTVVNGNFSTIDWSNGPYFIKSDFDPTGGTNYTISNTTQLLSVPYALHANIADKLSNPAAEKDPVYSSSVAFGITKKDTANWNAKLGSFAEKDPIFSKSIASLIDTVDIVEWFGKQDALTAGTGIKISNDTISSTYNNGYKHYLGEEFGGGIIFQLWKDNNGTEHGLIVAKKDQSVAQEWSNVNITLIGTNAQSTWDGEGNTAAIIAQSGHINSAAKLCDDYSASGFTDWYLPSIDELKTLYQNRFHVNRASAYVLGLNQIGNETYLSSTEYSTSIVWALNLGYGTPESNRTKSEKLFVRSIRNF